MTAGALKAIIPARNIPAFRILHGLFMLLYFSIYLAATSPVAPGKIPEQWNCNKLIYPSSASGFGGQLNSNIQARGEITAL
jgi:hypothetical protein